LWRRLHAAVLKRYDIAIDRLMVGNSLKSDVAGGGAGGQAVAPYVLTWAHGAVDDADASTYHQVDHLGELPRWWRALRRSGVHELSS
jgi:hypothetical protein